MMRGIMNGMEIIRGMVLGNATANVTIQNTSQITAAFQVGLEIGQGVSGSGCGISLANGIVEYSRKSISLGSGQQGSVSWPLDLNGWAVGSYQAVAKVYASDGACLDGKSENFTVEAPKVSAQIVSITIS